MRKLFSRTSPPRAAAHPRPASWVGYAVTGVLIAAICGMTWWVRVQSAGIDAMAVSTEARSAARQLLDRAGQLIGRAEQLTLLAARPGPQPRARDFLMDGTANSAVILVDAAGRVTDSTVLPAGHLLAQAPYLAGAAAAGPALRVGVPLELVPGRAPGVPLVRSLYDAAGRYTGAVVLEVRAGYFTETQSLPRRRNTLFALVNPQGQAVALSVDGRSPPLPLPRLAAPVWSDVQRRGTTEKNLPVLAGIFDNEPRFTLLAGADTHHLRALVGVPFVSASVNTKNLFKAVYLVVGLVSLSIVAVAALIRRQTRRLRDSLATQAQAREALHKEKEFFALTLGSIEEGVVTLDTQGRITYGNRGAEQLLDWALRDAIGQHVSRVVHLCRAEEATPRTAELLAGGHGAAQLVARTGARRSVEFSVTALAAPHEGTRTVLVLRDVSHATQLAHTLSYQASHDALTGLLNRTAFDNKVEAALEAAAREDSRHVLLFLDLDQFKVVNDSCGHAAGDELLKQVAFLFGQALRRGDTLARTGGDEFAVLLENCPASVAMGLADKLRSQLASFRFAWQDKSFQVGVSIGAVEITATSGSRGELMRKADTACYIAKDGGRGRTHLYLDSDEAVMARQGELSWATRLQKALAHGEFELHGQRIVAPQRQAPGHYFEVLVRLRDEDGTLVPPMAFLPAAERYGLMPALDRAVLVRALQMHRELQAAAAAPVKFAVNLSGASLSDPALLPFIRDALAEHRVAPQHICFEVTETVAIANLQVAVTLMRGLKELGCTLSLDDFGSGMSSFSYLKQLPVDVVKIDGSFVRSMLANPVDYAMVEAVNHIAHQMGLQTLAEYVESPELVAALTAMGVDMLQGYGVGRPGPLADMLASVQAAEAAPADSPQAGLAAAPEKTLPGQLAGERRIIPAALPVRAVPGAA